MGRRRSALSAWLVPCVAALVAGWLAVAFIAPHDRPAKCRAPSAAAQWSSASLAEAGTEGGPFWGALGSPDAEGRGTTVRASISSSI